MPMIRLFDFVDRQVDAIVAEGQEIIQKAVEGGLVGDVDFHRITAFSADAITIWCGEVEQAIQHFSPDAIVVFAGAARFLAGDPITMTKEDIASVAAAAPDSHVLVAHMETWNHCLLSRSELREFLGEHKLQERVFVPNDGEIVAHL